MKAILLLGLALVAADPAAAIDARLSERLDAATATAVAQLADSASAAGIPHEPLVATALEGASKQASGPRILAAVRRHAAALAVARAALGPAAPAGEVVAGAGALMSGVPPDTLTRLRLARPGVSLLVPLVVLADLVTRQVPIETAAAVVLRAARIGARDADLLLLRTRVEGDIRRGVTPGTATLARLRGLTGPGTAVPPAGPGEIPRRAARERR